MSGEVLMRQGVPLTLRLSKGEWNTFFNGLLSRGTGALLELFRREPVRCCLLLHPLEVVGFPNGGMAVGRNAGV
jgi:hypothetical protein